MKHHLLLEAKAKGLFPLAAPDELKETDIEAPIRDAVKLINQSGWAFTVFSCCGHGPRKEYDPDLNAMGVTKTIGTLPYLVLLCPADQYGQLVTMVESEAQHRKLQLSAFLPVWKSHTAWRYLHVEYATITSRGRKTARESMLRIAQAIRNCVP